MAFGISSQSFRFRMAEVKGLFAVVTQESWVLRVALLLLGCMT